MVYVHGEGVVDDYLHPNTMYARFIDKNLTFQKCNIPSTLTEVFRSALVAYNYDQHIILYYSEQFPSPLPGGKVIGEGGR